MIIYCKLTKHFENQSILLLQQKTVLGSLKLLPSQCKIEVHILQDIELEVAPVVDM